MESREPGELQSRGPGVIQGVNVPPTFCFARPPRTPSLFVGRSINPFQTDVQTSNTASFSASLIVQHEKLDDILSWQSRLRRGDVSLV